MSVKRRDGKGAVDINAMKNLTSICVSSFRRSICCRQSRFVNASGWSLFFFQVQNDERQIVEKYLSLLTRFEPTLTVPAGVGDSQVVLR
jgi:hypothetical protein